MNKQHLYQRRLRRTQKVRAKIRGTNECPRLSLFRSNAHLEAQIIDDKKGVTVCAMHDREIQNVKMEKDQTKNIARAFALGKALAEKAHAKKVVQVVFDRRGSRYHGRVRAFVEGARAGGLEF